MTKHWEGKYVVLSTAHITQVDDEALKQICKYKKYTESMLQIVPSDYGYIIIPAQRWVKEALAADCAAYRLEFSVWYPIFKYCKEHKYTMIRLDRDGSVVKDLKVFKW